MSRSTWISLCALAALATGAAACGDDGGATPDGPVLTDAEVPDAPPRQTIMENLLLVPGEVVEGIMTGGAGDLASIDLSAPASELDWNIHGHAGGGTQVVQEGFNLMVVDFTFAPTATADWYLLIRNSGPTDMMIQVRIGLYGTMQWRWE